MENQTDNNLNSIKPRRKPRFLLEVISGFPIALVDLGEDRSRVLKRYPREQLEEARKELARLEKKDRLKRKAKKTSE